LPVDDRQLQRRSRIVRSVWAACLLVGGLNHARILLQHGILWDYGGVNAVSAVYWSSLTLFDPLVAALLFVRPKAGITGTVVLIVTNVAHNLAITGHYTPAGQLLERVASAPFMLAQIAFMLFVAATAPIAWNGVAGGRSVDRS
jgi:hypothetical protein